MAVAFVQSLGSNQSKTAGTSLAIAVASLTVTAGNDIFVAFASDDVGSNYSVTDNLGNTYSQVSEAVNAGNVKAQLWRATGITGGTLTSITISWTTNATAKAMVAGEYSGIGAQDNVQTLTAAGASSISVHDNNTNAVQSGDIMVGAAGWERPGSDNLTTNTVPGVWTGVEVAQNGTTGGGATSNIAVQLLHAILLADDSSNVWTANEITAAADAATVGAAYSPAGAVVAAPYPYVGGHYYPTEG